MGWVVFVTMGGMDFVPCIPKNDEVCGRHSAARPLGTILCRGFLCLFPWSVVGIIDGPKTKTDDSTTFCRAP